MGIDEEIERAVERQIEAQFSDGFESVVRTGEPVGVENSATVRLAIDTARVLQEMLCVTPVLREVGRMGWRGMPYEQE